MYSVHTDRYTFPFQMDTIRRLMGLPEQQVKFWRDLSILKMRILLKFSPEQCDLLEEFITPMSYTLLNTDRRAIQLKNQRLKMIQETKRKWLNVSFHAYEI